MGLSFVSSGKRKIEKLLEIKTSGNKNLFDTIRHIWSLNKKYGISFSEYYLYEFEKQPEELADSFLTSRLKYQYLRILNPREYFSLARNKYLSHLFFKERSIPSAELYLYYDPFSSVRTEDLAYDAESVVDILRKKNCNRFVVKTTESYHGEGVVLYTDISFEENGKCLLQRYDGKGVDLCDILGKWPLIFESVIEQSRQMAGFSKNSVNTIRFMTTLYPDGKARIVNTFIKIGRGSSCVDNAGQGGNIDAAINVETGELRNVILFDGFRKITPISIHPDTKEKLEGVKIENWERIKKRVIEFQEKMPFLRAIGWDIAITDSGPIVVEMNDCWDETGQIFLRKGWKKEIQSCYEAWVKSSKR